MNILRQVLVTIHRFKVAWVKSRRFENVLGHSFDRRCLSQHIKFKIQIFIYWDRGKSLKYDMVKFSNYVHSLELHTKPLVNI